MYRPPDGIGPAGALVPGPPWILGHRGAPLESPENTQAGLQRAVALGLDGFEYDVRACRSGELVLMHDETLERTTSGRGRVAFQTLPELFGLDAGGWFAPHFLGEPIPLVSEALDVPGAAPGDWPQHMIELKEEGLVAELDRLLREHARELSVRVASFHLGTCREVRDAGWPAMLLADRATEDLRELVRREGFAAVGLRAGGWDIAAGEGNWHGERWAWSVDEPDDLLRACRRPLAGFNTNEPRRALAVRALAHLSDAERYPVEVPPLVVRPGELSGARGEWCGRWDVEPRVANPFPFPISVRAELFVRGGAFDVEGLPAARRLEPGDSWSPAFRLTGGSWSPGRDPRFVVHCAWEAGPGRPGEGLALDATLHRIRELRLRDDAQRVELLRERPGQPPATMTVQRRGGLLLVAIESPGELTEPHCVVRLGGRTHRGGRTLRARLPEELEHTGSTPFSCGIEGRVEGRPAVRRWAGRIGDGPLVGAPGRLLV